MSTPTPKTALELLACPFCGRGRPSIGVVLGIGTSEGERYPVATVECNCGARGPQLRHEAAIPDNALTAWNTRTPARRREGGEAVAWRIVPDDTLFLRGSTITDDPAVAENWRGAGCVVEPLYAHPPVVAGREEIDRAVLTELSRQFDKGARSITSIDVGGLVDAILSLTPDASRIRELEGALEFYANEWRQNGDGDTETPGLSRTWMEPTDVLFDDAGRRAKAALSSATKASGEEKR